MSAELNYDDRKFRKPLMEKKRRARINESLDNLKQILLECDPESVNKKNAKLEKADILEMTVRYLQNLKKKPTPPTSYKQYGYKDYSSTSTSKFGGYSSTSTTKYGGYSQSYVAGPFSGGQMYYGSSSYGYQKAQSYNQYSNQSSTKNGIWRPW